MTSQVIAGLVGDLADERAALIDVLTGRTEGDWARLTPAKEWDVRDQVVHLAHFDAITRTSIEDPEAFTELRESIPDLQEYVDGVGDLHRDRPGTDLLAWWAAEGDGLGRAALAADPTVRVPWFGPSMSLASKLTARIMETWAHGQDVVDAFGTDRPATDRLRHVARIGVLAFANSFRSRGLDVPATKVFVSLAPPGGGEPWTWGDPTDSERVTGPGLDFCLVVTQRRHVDDTCLAVSGPVARDWMHVAQAFAGPPGAGREPGQVAHSAVPTVRRHR